MQAPPTPRTNTPQSIRSRRMSIAVTSPAKVAPPKRSLPTPTLPAIVDAIDPLKCDTCQVAGTPQELVRYDFEFVSTLQMNG